MLYITYRCLIAERKNPDRSRLRQIEEWWCSRGAEPKSADAYDGCLLFDEAHKAKNLATNPPTKTALCVERLSQHLRGARIVYASATGASEAKHMAYMTRLGLWGDGCGFTTFPDFKRFVEKRGTGCMELLASDLKSRGAYLARTLSYEGATFDTEKVPLDDSQKSTIDECADYWFTLLQCLEQAASIAHLDTKAAKQLLMLYWGGHLRFFQQLVLGLKVDAVVKLTEESLAAGKCCVIGLQSTGEAGLTEWLGDQDADGSIGTTGVTDTLPSLPRIIVEQLLKKLRAMIDHQFSESADPLDTARAMTKILSQGDNEDGSDDGGDEEDDEDEDCVVSSSQYQDEPDAQRKQRLIKMHDDLSSQLDTLQLPRNALDDMIDKLGGVSKVAELSGRSGRMEQVSSASDGTAQYKYKKRTVTESDERVNIAERDHFQSGRKLVAILTDACSTGISLQANRSAPNTRRRVHVTIQLPWSAESVVQQFGRTHRSNQTSAPEYKLIMLSGVGGESRMSAGIASKMEALGAITKGDAKAGAATAAFGTNFHHLGKQALEQICNNNGSRTAAELERGGTLPDAVRNSSNRDAELDSFDQRIRESLNKMRLTDTKKVTVDRFLNRIFGLRLSEQTEFFSYFEQVHTSLLRAESASGSKKSIVDIAGSCTLKSRDTIQLSGSSATAEHIVLEKDRGVSFAEMLKKFDEATHCDNTTPAVWRSKKAWQGVNRIIYTEQTGNDSTLTVIRGGTGRIPGGMMKSDLDEKYKLLTRTTHPRSHVHIERLWTEQHDAAVHECSHGGSCAAGSSCTVGKRIQDVHILTGNVSEAWARVVRLANRVRLGKVVRAVCPDETESSKTGVIRIVGLQLPTGSVEDVLSALSKQPAATEQFVALELTLRQQGLSADASSLVSRLCSTLAGANHSGISIVKSICSQLTPAIVQGINTCPDTLSSVTFLEGAFQPLLFDLREEKRLLKEELCRQLQDDPLDEGACAAVPPDVPSDVRADILSKLQEGARKAAERRTKRDEQKRRAQAGLDDDDSDDFADVEPSPMLVKTKKKKKKKHRKSDEDAQASSKPTAKSKSAAAKRLDRAAADQRQSKIPQFSSLASFNSRGTGTAASPAAAGAASDDISFGSDIDSPRPQSAAGDISDNSSSGGSGGKREISAAAAESLPSPPKRLKVKQQRQSNDDDVATLAAAEKAQCRQTLLAAIADLSTKQMREVTKIALQMSE